MQCVGNKCLTEYADNDAVVAFHQYFRSTWLDGMFPVALLNQYNVDSRMRTSNYVESWHARFNRVVHGAHPNLYMFIAHGPMGSAFRPASA